MKTKTKFFGLIGTVVLLTSCANYNHISENDVYFQKPTELSLDEDETDITSFNAFNARQKGAFSDEYNDPRINQRSLSNSIILRSSYMPFGLTYGGPMAFHGMGHSFYGYSNYYNRRYGYGYGMGGYYGTYGLMGGPFATPFHYDMYVYGSPYYYSPYSYGYTNHYGYNPYYYGGGYYGGGHYAGSNYNSGNANHVTYYGQRSGATSSSTRSSNYENTLKKTPVTTNNIYSSSQGMGTSRRAAGVNTGGVGSTTGMTPQSTSTKHVSSTSNTHYRSGTTSSQNRRVNQNYQPNTSSQRAGITNNRRVNTATPTRGVNSTVSPASQRTRTTAPSQNRVNPQSRQQQPAISTGSRGGTPSGTVRSGGNSGRR